jgi:hypothetical protein
LLQEEMKRVEQKKPLKGINFSRYLAQAPALNRENDFQAWKVSLDNALLQLQQLSVRYRCWFLQYLGKKGWKIWNCWTCMDPTLGNSAQLNFFPFRKRLFPLCLVSLTGTSLSQQIEVLQKETEDLNALRKKDQVPCLCTFCL